MTYPNQRTVIVHREKPKYGFLGISKLVIPKEQACRSFFVLLNVDDLVVSKLSENRFLKSNLVLVSV